MRSVLGDVLYSVRKLQKLIPVFLTILNSRSRPSSSILTRNSIVKIIEIVDEKRNFQHA